MCYCSLLPVDMKEICLRVHVCVSLLRLSNELLMDVLFHQDETQIMMSFSLSRMVSSTFSGLCSAPRKPDLDLHI